MELYPSLPNFSISHLQMQPAVVVYLLSNQVSWTLVTEVLSVVGKSVYKSLPGRKNLGAGWPLTL